MKKLIVLLMVLGWALPSQAGVKIKDVIGTWKYVVEVDGQTLTGKLEFEKAEKGLTGEALTDNGEVYVLNDIAIKEDNVLQFTLKINGLLHKVHVTLLKDKFDGTISNPEGEAPIKGEKIS